MPRIRSQPIPVWRFAKAWHNSGEGASAFRKSRTTKSLPAPCILLICSVDEGLISLTPLNRYYYDGQVNSLFLKLSYLTYFVSKTGATISRMIEIAFLLLSSSVGALNSASSIPRICVCGIASNIARSCVGKMPFGTL